MLIRMSTSPFATARKRSRAIFSARARSAKKVKIVGRVAKSEPLRARRPMSNASIPPEAEPKLANMPNGLRQSSEAGKVALPTPS